MATALYKYKQTDNLMKIAKLYNIDIPSIVRLNPWLKDINDGHTYIKLNNISTAEHVDINKYCEILNTNPNAALELNYKPIEKLKTRVTLVNKDSNGINTVYNFRFKESSKTDSGIYYEILIDDTSGNEIYVYTESSEIRKLNELVSTEATQYCIVNYTLGDIPDTIKIPLIGNGGQTIEDYWQTFDAITGAASNVTIDNVISKALNTYDDTDEDAAGGYPLLMEPPTFQDFNDTANLLSANYIKYNLSDNPKIQSSNISDYALSNLMSLVKVATNFVDSSDNYGENTNSVLTASKFTKNKFNSNIYGHIGNAAYAKCIIILGKKTLYMPCFPEDFSEQLSANYNDNIPLGRSEPFLVYEYTDARSVSLTFKMHREMLGSDKASIEKIENIVRVLESAVYPNYSGNVAPTPCTCTIGKSLYIHGVITQATAAWHGPIGPDDKYNCVDVTIAIKESTGNPFSRDDIAKYGSYRKR